MANSNEINYVNTLLYWCGRFRKEKKNQIRKVNRNVCKIKWNKKERMQRNNGKIHLPNQMYEIVFALKTNILISFVLRGILSWLWFYLAWVYVCLTHVDCWEGDDVYDKFHLFAKSEKKQQLRSVTNQRIYLLSQMANRISQPLCTIANL